MRETEDVGWTPPSDPAQVTPEEIARWPDRFLSGALKFHCRSWKAKALPEQVQWLCAEARKRGKERIWCWWAVQMLDPDRCACGGPGHYIVGSTTYCGKCKDKATARVVNWNRKLDARRDARTQAIQEQERLSRRLDAVKAYERSQRKTQKGMGR